MRPLFPANTLQNILPQTVDTRAKMCYIISCVRHQRYARVVELVDSLASGASALCGRAGSTPASCISPRILIRGLLLCSQALITNIYGICSRKVMFWELYFCPEIGLTLILTLYRLENSGLNGLSNASKSCETVITTRKRFELTCPSAQNFPASYWRWSGRRSPR